MRPKSAAAHARRTNSAIKRVARGLTKINFQKNNKLLLEIKNISPFDFGTYNLTFSSVFIIFIQC